MEPGGNDLLHDGFDTFEKTGLFRQKKHAERSAHGNAERSGTVAGGTVIDNDFVTRVLMCP